MEIVGFEWKQHRPKYQPSSGEESHLKAVSYFLVSFNGTLVHANADMLKSSKNCLPSFYTMWASTSPKQVQITTFSSQWSPWTSTSPDRFKNNLTKDNFKKSVTSNASWLPDLSHWNQIFQKRVYLRLATTSISHSSPPVSLSVSPGSHSSYQLTQCLAGGFFIEIYNFLKTLKLTGSVKVSYLFSPSQSFNGDDNTAHSDRHVWQCQTKRTKVQKSHKNIMSSVMIAHYHWYYRIEVTDCLWL